ncbi:MAG: electron transfer flavoprotein subunit alpha/FixB family protein [bacterium]|nr:MAG: electron transfer flavoprotein subunit alpha/FixB family protein [bacterium]
MSNILVIYEIREKNIKKVSFEATTAANLLARQLSGKVSALLLGSNLGSLTDKPGVYGAEKVYTIDNPALEKHSPDVFAHLISETAKEIGATHIIMGATAMGKDIMPRVAFRLNCPLVQDIIGLEVQNNKVSYQRPIIAGKLRSRVSLQSEIQLATIRPNIFQAQENKVSSEVVALAKDLPTPRVIVEETLATGGGKLDVTEAEIIVSGGRGMQGPDNWHLIENLAKTLGAATGASRAVVDSGWREHGEQVGQTGKTVSPNLYIACGISGAIQHQAGMASSKYIVAINKDPEAPIFKLADYGIVGDVKEVLPKLNEEVAKVRGE